MTEQRGLSLIELLVFIVVVGVAVVGVVSVYSLNAHSSADPMVRKQALAIAESLLEEVLAKPYTYCDPDDANVESAANAGECAIPEGMGSEVAQDEARDASLALFDNVNDYDGFAMAAIRDLNGNAVPELNGYSASIQVQPAGAFNGIAAGETLLVTVTVTAPGNHNVSLSGYRTRYAPNF